MFTVFVVPSQDITPSHSLPPSSPAWPHHQHPHNAKSQSQQPQQPQQHLEPGKPSRDQELEHIKSQLSTLPSRRRDYSLMATLQSSVFFGGFGSLVRQIEAMDRQLAAEALLRSSPSSSSSSSSSSSVKPKNTVADEQQGQGQVVVVAAAPTRATTDHPAPPTASESAVDAVVKLQRDSGDSIIYDGKHGTNNGGESMKRYRITLEELSDDHSNSSSSPIALRHHDRDGNDDGHQHTDAATTEDRATVVMTTTATMPPSLVSWLLHATGQAQQGQQPDQSSSVTPAITPPPLPHSPNTATKDAGVQQRVAKSSDKDMADLVAALSADISSGTLVPAPPMPVLIASAPSSDSAGVDKTSSSSSSSFSTPSPKTIDAKAKESSDESAVLVNKVKEIRPSWEQKRTAETTDKLEHAPPRQWPPRRRTSNQTFTQTTITRPDGTVESKTVTMDRETGVAETRFRVQHPDGSVQESTWPERTISSTPPSTFAPQQQQQQQSDASIKTEHESHRSAFRERMSQRRQERCERRRERQERRQELRDAESKQREATAVAYGFVYNDPDAETISGRTTADPHSARTETRPHHGQSYHTAWHQRREERQREREQMSRREEDELQGERESRVKTWPPKAYLRRMEQEQGREPRHNV
ncbi:hypothetical protein BGZ99_000290 [Dissophora globulifera]|uniref:Uncharacterized protein n=1 Tax=Dissophora globulifera TaxID=979702 RepID=A0A9P6ULR0_9FUNG|nr:hypothetical protein BGZ99_000290 [Dissophora globulifera]